MSARGAGSDDTAKDIGQMGQQRRFTPLEQLLSQPVSFSDAFSALAQNEHELDCPLLCAVPKHLRSIIALEVALSAYDEPGFPREES